jgi:hypothetical protein
MLAIIRGLDTTLQVLITLWRSRLTTRTLNIFELLKSSIDVKPDGQVKGITTTSLYYPLNYFTSTHSQV